jgi:hypothetical protein
MTSTSQDLRKALRYLRHDAAVVSLEGRPCAAAYRDPSQCLRAEAGEMIDFASDGGAMSWRNSAGEAEAFYQSIYLIELGWRAWHCMGEENILGHMGYPDHLVSFLEGGLGW